MSKQTAFRLEDFIVESPIGQGAYGQIYKAVEVGTGKVYALKAMNRRCLMKMKKQSLPIVEKNALIKCASTFVVRLYGTFKDDSNLYFVLELAEHGDLAEAVGDIGSLNTNVVKLLSAQIFEAICVCHKANVIHRDLKPENILLDSQNHVLLSDFGTALIEKSDSQELNRSSIVELQPLLPQSSLMMEKSVIVLICGHLVVSYSIFLQAQHLLVDKTQLN
ncbi:AGC family protein kinase [Histomonas meleagridis]|nr:AGC family protein kinase [Histomonas meleagridis]